MPKKGLDCCPEPNDGEEEIAVERYWNTAPLGKGECKPRKGQEKIIISRRWQKAKGSEEASGKRGTRGSNPYGCPKGKRDESCSSSSSSSSSCSLSCSCSSCSSSSSSSSSEDECEKKMSRSKPQRKYRTRGKSADKCGAKKGKGSDAVKLCIKLAEKHRTPNTPRRNGEKCDESDSSSSSSCSSSDSSSSCNSEDDDYKKFGFRKPSKSKCPPRKNASCKDALYKAPGSQYPPKRPLGEICLQCGEPTTLRKCH
nr:unnamed protein product [Spirometra erinaceieuropaei]